VRRVGGHNGRAAGQVHVDTTGVFLGGILQAEFLADLFDARLDLLDVAGGMVALADDPGWVLERHFLMGTAKLSRMDLAPGNSKAVLSGRCPHVHMKMILSMRLGIFNALFQNLLGLLDKLSMQIDRIGLNAPVGIVLAEDKLRRLLVVFLHLAPVRLALF
jgi:hypothetical protein